MTYVEKRNYVTALFFVFKAKNLCIAQVMEIIFNEKYGK